MAERAGLAVERLDEVQVPFDYADDAELAAELVRVRAQGWALADEQLAPGVRSVAAPVRDQIVEALVGLGFAAKQAEQATDTVLAGLPAKGVTKVAIFAPGFSADCVETLEELLIRGRETFEEAGGTHFGYLPCLNDSMRGIAMLRELIARELEGWTARP